MLEAKPLEAASPSIPIPTLHLPGQLHASRSVLLQLMHGNHHFVLQIAKKEGTDLDLVKVASVSTQVPPPSRFVKHSGGLCWPIERAKEGNKLAAMQGTVHVGLCLMN